MFPVEAEEEADGSSRAEQVAASISRDDLGGDKSEGGRDKADRDES